MSRDMHHDILDRIRQSGFVGSGVLNLSRHDAERLIRSIPELDAVSATPEQIDTYAGTRDVAGVITYRLDEELQPDTAPPTAS